MLNDEGYKVGTIQRSATIIEGYQWGWHINGEIVGAQVQANGSAPDRETATAAFAKSWRRWLERNGLSEPHRPMYGNAMDMETRRRLKLPVRGHRTGISED